MVLPVYHQSTIIVHHLPYAVMRLCLLLATSEVGFKASVSFGAGTAPPPPDIQVSKDI